MLGPKNMFSFNTMKPFSKVRIPADSLSSSTPYPHAHLQPSSRLLYEDMSYLRSTYPMGISVLLSHPDVNSWLLTFGFQLHNVIPGYPKPDMDAMEPSYELVHTQMKTQEWDNSKVIHAHGRPPLWPIRHYMSGSHQLLRKA